MSSVPEPRCCFDMESEDELEEGILNKIEKRSKEVDDNDYGDDKIHHEEEAFRRLFQMISKSVLLSGQITNL